MRNHSGSHLISVLRAIVAVTAPSTAGCASSELIVPAVDSTVDARLDVVPDAVDTDVCSATNLPLWTLEELTARGFCNGPSAADPPFHVQVARVDGGVAGDAGDRVLGRPCDQPGAQCSWPGAGGRNYLVYGYRCVTGACPDSGQAVWFYQWNAGGPLMPPEVPS